MNDIFRAHGSGIELRVRLTPNSGRDEVVGISSASDGSAYLAARVRAIPEKGAANIALEKLVARWLGVSRSCVRVSGGTKSRIKTVTVDGDATHLTEAIRQLLSPR